MAQMPVTLGTTHFGPNKATTDIGKHFDLIVAGGVIKRRPTTTGIEFFIRSEQERITAHANILPRALLLKLLVNPPIGTLGSIFAQNSILLGSELFFCLLYTSDAADE